MPVQAIVTAAQIAARKPHSPMMPPVSPKNTQPMPKTAAGTKVSTDMTPSRDSQEKRHCEKARQARSGRPRWNTEETRPAAAGRRARAARRQVFVGRAITELRHQILAAARRDKL